MRPVTTPPLGLMGPPGRPPLPPAQLRALVGDYRRRLTQCVPWNPAMKWQPQLNLQGATYGIRELFPTVGASLDPVHALAEGLYVDSPGGSFRYCVRVQPRGRPLLTWWGSQVGTVIFDAPVGIPALFQARPGRAPDDPERWNEHPWMSLTPGEYLTLRPGTRMARGHTIVAGLGLAHQLIEVTRRLQVKRVTLVELSQELVDWLMPVVTPLLRKPVDVIVGDAYEVIPQLRADVALVDIFPGYGNAQAQVAELAARSPGIKKFWGWGTSEMSGRRLRSR